MTLDRLVLLFCLVVLVAFTIRDARAASNEHLMMEKACKSVAAWSTDVYKTIKESPKVILNGMDSQDEIAFAFIRQWIKDGKSSDDLYVYTFNACMGTPV